MAGRRLWCCDCHHEHLSLAGDIPRACPSCGKNPCIWSTLQTSFGKALPVTVPEMPTVPWELSIKDMGNTILDGGGRL